MATIVTMGVFTPPVGSAIYPVCSIIDCSVEEYTKESMHFSLQFSPGNGTFDILPSGCNVPAQSSVRCVMKTE